MLTGYADTKTAKEAINKGEIYKFIMKPWHDQDLKFTIKDSVLKYELMCEKKHFENELHRSNKKHMELDKIKSEFFLNIISKIITPINFIKNNLIIVKEIR